MGFPGGSGGKESTCHAGEHRGIFRAVKIEMGLPDHLTCLLRNLYIGQEAIVRNGHGKADWLKTGKGDNKAVYCHPDYLTYM